MTFSGVTTVDLKGIHYAFRVGCEMSSWFALGGCLYASMSRSRRLWIAYLIILGELVWAAFSGRRAVLFWFVTLALGSIVRTGAVPRLRVIATVAAGVFAIYFGSAWFLPARAAAERAEYRTAASRIVAGVQEGNRALSDDSSATYARQNWAVRPLISRFATSVIAAASEGRDFLGGGALVTSALWSVPLPLGQKPVLQTEQLIEASFGIPLSDTSITWLVVGYADFGLLGVFTYGFLFCAALTAIVHFSARSNFCLLLKMCLVAGATALVFNIEEDPTAFFVFLRDSAVVLLGSYLFRIALRGARRNVLLPP